MNKEVIIAIIIGVGLGLFGALYFANSTPGAAVKTEVNSIKNIQISPRVSLKGKSLATFDKLPENESLVSKNTLTISGKAENSSNLIIANRVAIIPVTIKKEAFKTDFRLKPGVNEIALYELNGEKEQLKVIKLYYFEVPEAKKVGSEEKEASGEAAVLKQKLEEKVLELRSKPSSVVHGAIKSIAEKQITLDDDKGSVKITVEPEVTNFYDISGYNLEETKYDDLEKGDEVTAFVSDIGGDEISYTLYREPVVTIAVGKISNIDDKTYKVTMVDFDKSSFGADVDTTTTQNVYDLKTKEVSKGGFSKLAIGNRIFAILNGTKENYTISEYLVLR